MRRIFFIILVMQVMTLSSHAQNERRLALVIGNSAYQHGGALKNPVNDANLIAETLKDLGFVVIKRTNATLTDMQASFLQFVRQMNNYDVILFFYAGHGMQVNGENYLLPIDAKAESAMSLEFEGFEVGDVNKYFAANSGKTNIMILDACRDNPYRSWSRGGNRGFRAVSNQGAGTIIAFATSEGQTASDGSGNNGLYTTHLVKQMQVSQNITDVFQNTRIEVLKASNNSQIPQEWNMLTGNFNFIGNESARPDVKQPGTKGPSLGSSTSTAAYGSIEFSTEVGGKLYLDGQLLGEVSDQSKTPINDILVGSHNLELRGNRNWSGQVIISANQMSYVSSVAGSDDTSDMLFMDMVRISGGSFMMGSNSGSESTRPAHKVELSTYEIGKYEVTWGQWIEIMGRDDTRVQKYFNDCEQCPAEYISWGAAYDFAEKLSNKTGQYYRLPTEAEWEYAARGGANGDQNMRFAGGDNISEVAWSKENSDGKTQPVGQKAPNSLGIYDMTGNVAEWCSDYFKRRYYVQSPQMNPKGPSFGVMRSLRGGSYSKSADYSEVTDRVGVPAADWTSGIGFRLVRDIQ